MLLRVEKITTDIEGDIDPYAFRKLAANFYSRSRAVRYGDDFENNLLLRFPGTMDKYVKIKLGKSKLTEAVKKYNEPFLALPEGEMELLLHLCRFCSYIGGPGVPDMLLVDSAAKGGARRALSFRQLNVELHVDRLLFIAAAQALGYDVALYDVETREHRVAGAEKEYDVLAALRSAVRSNTAHKRLAEQIEELSQRSDAQSRDEASFLKDEQAKMPFLVMEKWLAAGQINVDDLRQHMESVRRINEKFAAEMLRYESELRSDSAYSSFSRARSDENLRQKAEYIKNKFAIGASRAVEAMNRVE